MCIIYQIQYTSEEEFEPTLYCSFSDEDNLVIWNFLSSVVFLVLASVAKEKEEVIVWLEECRSFLFPIAQHNFCINNKVYYRFCSKKKNKKKQKKNKNKKQKQTYFWLNNNITNFPRFIVENPYFDHWVLFYFKEECCSFY